MLPVPDPARRISRLQAREVYANQFGTLFDDDVSFPDGSAGRYLRLVAGDGSPPAAALVTCADRVALVLTHRYPIDRWEWGIPRGLATGEDSRATVLTELQEELGGEPIALKLLGAIHPDSGLLATRADLFHAQWATPSATPEDTREILAVAWLTAHELDEAIADGVITDGFTLAALTLARVRGVFPSDSVAGAPGQVPAGHA